MESRQAERSPYLYEPAWMLVRRFLTLALLLTVWTTAGTQASAGGDCPGMSDYTYQHGECTDNAGDVYSVLEKSYDREYDLGRERIGHMVTSQSARAVPIGGNAAALNAQLAKRMLYTPQANAIYPTWYAARVYPHDAAARKRLIPILTTLAENYHRTGAQYGFNPNVVPDAAAMYIMAAYRVFDKDRYADPIATRAGYIWILTTMAHNPHVLGLDNQGRQLLAESYAVRAQALELLSENARRNHDAASEAALRAQARKSLQNELGVDPAAVGINELPCTSPHPLSCKSYLALIRAEAGGSASTAPQMSRIISPANPR